MCDTSYMYHNVFLGQCASFEAKKSAIFSGFSVRIQVP